MGVVEIKEIPLTQGKVALVDDEDYVELSKFKWCAYNRGNTYYAMRNSPRDPITHKCTFIHMHTAILNTPKGLYTDHINGNGIDNRRENLRIVTARQNAQNRHEVKTSKYPGVGWFNRDKKWRAYISINCRQHHLGLYSDEDVAAAAYQYACDHPESIRQIRTPSSKYHGVSWNKRRQKWHVRIRANGAVCHLGYYLDEQTAGLVYAMANNALKMGCVL